MVLIEGVCMLGIYGGVLVQVAEVYMTCLLSCLKERIIAESKHLGPKQLLMLSGKTKE